jgi:hypothetical protein
MMTVSDTIGIEKDSNNFWRIILGGSLNPAVAALERLSDHPDCGNAAKHHLNHIRRSRQGWNVLTNSKALAITQFLNEWE